MKAYTPIAISETNPYDIFSLQSARNHSIYDQMRIEDPIHAAIHPQTGQTVWFLTRYDDCLTFLKDKRFGKSFRQHLPPEMSDKWGGIAAESIINQHMLNLDDPSHTRLKSLVHLAFTPVKINTLRVKLQQIADSLFDVIDAEVIDGDEFDLTQRYISQLPLLSIAAMLGIPLVDYQMLHHWTQMMLSSEPHIAHTAIAEFSDYLDNLIELRHKNSEQDDDLLSALIFAEDAGDHLTRPELLAMVFLLITAGYETMVSFITNAVFAFLENPSQMQLLRKHINNAAILKTTIEEILRYNGPSHMTLASWAFEDVQIGTKQIHQGDIVHAVLAAANHDPHIFIDPHRFDILRTPNKHIAFSYGIHHCLGAALARLEGEIAITTLLRRMPDL